jgi:GNAT superfamily N-acetyltransferase/2'-5' RNA ligase
LTFEDSSDLQLLAGQCQAAISFPYYDLTPPSELHLTLSRIAAQDDITSDQLHAVEAAAKRACDGISPFDIRIGFLAGTSGAVGFSVAPGEPIGHLRDVLHEATRSAYPNAATASPAFHPHVTIAYCNSDDVPAAPAIAAVERLNSLPCVEVTVKKGALVLLERRPRAYMRQAISRISLLGGDGAPGARTGILVIRRFQPNDLTQVLAINAYGLTAAGIAVDDDFYAGQDLADIQGTYAKSAGGVLLVGGLNEQIVAMGGIRRIDTTTCELLRMRVRSEHQGQGYGTAILRLLERQAKELGYQRIVLLTGEEQHPAVDLYTRAGYRVTRREMLLGIPSVHTGKDLRTSEPTG